MRVGYYSPLPPSTSGVADYSALLLPALSRRVDVVVARPGRLRRPPAADVALYHLGNDPAAHGWILEALRRRPGVVVLHDFVLHHLISGTTLARGDVRGYLDALEREHGLPGRLLGYAVVDNRLPPLWETRPEAFPLAGEVLALASGLIVHSGYVEDRVREAGFHGPVWRVPHPAWPVPELRPAAVPGEPVFGCFGHLNEAKRVPHVLSAFARLRDDRPKARLLLVGRLSQRLEGLELPEGVIREGYVEERRFWELMAACDVCVNLRSPTMGETSGTVVRALSLGRALVVSDVGWFSELPAEVAVRVAPDEHEVDFLHAALELLARDEERRGAMGRAARQLAEREHALERVAELYAAALEEAAGGAAVREAVLEEVAVAAAAVGLTETTDLARRLDELGLGR